MLEARAFELAIAYASISVISGFIAVALATNLVRRARVA
jgi:hypothetical protein